MNDLSFFWRIMVPVVKFIFLGESVDTMDLKDSQMAAPAIIGVDLVSGVFQRQCQMIFFFPGEKLST